jgi:RNA recognition motif-containing protein
VTFANEKSMNDAIEAMNGQDLDRRNITVNQAQSRGSGGGAVVVTTEAVVVVREAVVVGTKGCFRRQKRRENENR